MMRKLLTIFHFIASLPHVIFYIQKNLYNSIITLSPMRFRGDMLCDELHERGFCGSTDCLWLVCVAIWIFSVKI